MEFRLLGPLEVLDGDRPLSVGGPRQRALLAILLVHANEVMASDQLVDGLWVAPPETAGNTLQAHVSRLRKVLGSTRIVTQKPGYVLRLEDGERDVERFEALAAQGRDALAAGDPDRAGRLLRSALAIWRGPPLADLGPERFAIGEIKKLEEQRLAALEDRIDADLAVGRHTVLVPELEQLIVEYSLRERLRCQLMLALYRSGRQAEALEVYRQTRKLLVDELGIEPGPALRRLETAILLHDPRLERTVPASDEDLLPPVPYASRRLPLIGRRVELGQLNQILDAARSRSDCHLATVIGSAGIGKSRLADEFLQESRGGAETVVGHCLPHGEGTPLWPITDIVKQLAGDVTSEAIAQLLSADPLADEIAARLSPLVNPIAEADLDDVAWAAKKFIESVAAQRALVAVLDDVQWASEPLLNVIDYLTDWSSGVPLLLVCLARPELLDRRPTWGGGKPNATAISLDALSQSEASVLLSRVPGSAALGEAERAHILEVGDGNPLFLEEMVALARDQPGLPLKVPPTITAILAARLTRLSGPEQHVLTRAAIVGRDPTLNALNSIVDRRVVRDVVPVLRRLVRKDFLRPQRSMIRGDEAFRFRHVLIRDVAYESAPVPSRAAVHEKVGQWLAGRAAEVGDDIQPVVGHHLERAHALGRYEDAPHKRRRLALRAAAALSSQREYEVGPAGIRERIDCLQRAAALLAEHGMPRARILADIGVDLEQQSQWVAAATRYAEAQALGQEAGDQDLVTYVGLLLEILAGRAATSFTLNDALTAAEAAFTELSTSRNPLYADRVRATLASMHLSGGKAAECEELLAPLVAERKGSWTRVQHMSLRVLMAAWVWGPRSVAFAVSRCEAVLAERTPLRVEASASRYLAVLRAMEGRFDEARTYIERDQAILNELGLRAAAAGMQVFRGVIELLAENPSEAENVLRPALEILQGLREQWYSGGVAAVLAQALCAQQKLGESWEMTILSAELNSRDVAVPIWNAATRAKVLSANGDPRAVVEAEHAVRLARATDHINEEAGSLFTLGFVASTLGDDLTSASAALSRASALYAAKGNTVMLNQTHNLLRSLESIL